MTNEIKRTQAHKQTGDLFELLVRNVKDYAIFVLDLKGNIVTWNAGAEETLGYKETEITGQNIALFYKEEDVRISKPLNDLEVTGRDGRLESEGWYLHKDGNMFWANVVFTALRDNEGELVAIAVIIRDLTERLQAEEKLRQSEEAFRLTVRAVKEYAIFLLDRNGYIMTWNEGAQRTKGYTAEQIIGKHFSSFYPIEARESGHPAFELEQAILHGHFEEEGWRLRRDGSRFWARVTITPIMDELSQHRGFVKITQDLTERKRTHESLKEARDEAVEANKLKSQFIAGISHEIRTPMAGIIGLTELLSLNPPDQETKEIVDSLLESSKRLLQILNNLLDFSKLETAKFVVENVPFSIEAIIQDVIRNLQPEAAKKQVKVECSIDAEIPGIVIGDGFRIRQVLDNLTNNALKFTHTGQIKIQAELQNKINEELSVKFSIVDSGIGIAQANQTKIFSPFVQAESSTSRRFGGTGLGLSNSKQFIELMSGTIGFESKEDEGSTFWFIVPLRTESLK
ncbi:MAG: PAS domain S-box protein [Candidatus Obscuribacterales bacterium]|nr:PAS domain S-box protein [Candidatus Obscuribacterales bacterium]